MDNKEKKEKEIKVLTLRIEKKWRDKIDAYVDNLDEPKSRNLWIVETLILELKRLDKKKKNQKIFAFIVISQ